MNIKKMEHVHNITSCIASHFPFDRLEPHITRVTHIVMEAPANIAIMTGEYMSKEFVDSVLDTVTMWYQAVVGRLPSLW
jgi:hypothetical protein